MEYLVPPPSCFGGAEFRTRLKLILHNNACAVIRDTKTKNRAETSTRCLTARVISNIVSCVPICFCNLPERTGVILIFAFHFSAVAREGVGGVGPPIIMERRKIKR